jgi:DNA-directed RNA polymerase specialized sigma24 family protein
MRCRIAAIEDPQNNPEVTLQCRQKTEILLCCLTQLSPAHREIIDLVYYHEKSIDEVAESHRGPAQNREDAYVLRAQADR